MTRRPGSCTWMPPMHDMASHELGALGHALLLLDRTLATSS